MTVLSQLSLFIAASALPVAASCAAETITIRREVVPIAPVSAVPGLTLVGAWRLSADHRGFGGFSGLLFIEGEFLMLSDAGWLVRWKPDGSAAEIEPLPEACRSGDGEHSLDAEAMSLTPDGLELRVALERPARLCAFSWGRPDTARAFALDGLPAMRGNRGVEAMAALPKRGVALLAEGAVDGAHKLTWFDSVLGDRRAVTVNYHAPSGFKPGDAAFLPDGRLLVVNRRFGLRGGRASVLSVGAFSFPLTRAIDSEAILRIEGGPLAANFEGVAVQPDGDDIIIWLVSDDNFSNPKGTVLLQLRFNTSIETRSP